MPPKAMNPCSLIIPSYKNATTYASFLEEIIKSNLKRSNLLTTENINMAWEHTSTKRHFFNAKALSLSIEEAHSKENRSLLDKFVSRYNLPSLASSSSTPSSNQTTTVELPNDMLWFDEIDIEPWVRKRRKCNAGRELSLDEIKDAFDRYVTMKSGPGGVIASAHIMNAKKLRRKAKAHFKGRV